MVHKRGFLNWFFIVVSLLSLFNGCYTLEGHVGVSQNMEESKKRNVFVASVVNFDFSRNSDLSFECNFTKGWVEKKWHHGNNLNETVLDSTITYQVILEFETDSCLEGYSEEWYAGISGDHYLRIASSKSLMGDLSNINNKIQWFVQKEMNLTESSEKTIIGKIEVELLVDE